MSEFIDSYNMKVTLKTVDGFEYTNTLNVCDLNECIFVLSQYTDHIVKVDIVLDDSPHEVEVELE